MIAHAKRAHKRFKSALKTVKKNFAARQAGWKRSITKATVVVVTGSSCKTSATSLLTHILSADDQVLSQTKGNKLREAIGALNRLRPTDRYLVLEQGTQAPGDLPESARLIKPDVAVVTLVALEHYSAFRSIEAVAKEKAAFVESLPSGGLAVLNFDDPNVRTMSPKSGAKVVKFGTQGGDYRVRDISVSADGYLNFAISSNACHLSLRTQFVGPHNWLAIAAAVVCASELGVSAETIIDRVASFKPVFGRMSVHSLPGGPTFILDTAKAPLHSLTLPLDALKAITSRKKRFILGQISDYAGASIPKYRETYVAAAKVADEVCFVGPNAKKARASEEDIRSGKFRAFSTPEQLALHLKETATAGEVILVKSSRNMHLERLMLDLQTGVQCWPSECSMKYSCRDCGLYDKPYFEHNGKSDVSKWIWGPRRHAVSPSTEA